MKYQSNAYKALNDWCTRLRPENTHLQKENKELRAELLRLRKDAA